MISAQKVFNHYLEIKRYIRLPKIKMVVNSNNILLSIGTDTVSPEVASVYLTGFTWNKILKKFYSNNPEGSHLFLEYAPNCSSYLWVINKTIVYSETNKEDSILSRGYYPLEAICNCVHHVLTLISLKQETF